MTALRAFAELNEPGTKIEVHFSYSPEAVAAIRAVPGRSFKGDATPKHWTIPLTLDAARRLREEFGQGLVLGDALKAWGREATRTERNLTKLASADDADLSTVRPEQAAWLRPYQRADVAMMAAANVLNANQPGVGKTVEVIYAVEELAKPGPNVVVCPNSLFKDPWLQELAEHAPGQRVFWGSTPAERRRALVDFLAYVEEFPSAPCWLLVNPDFIRAESDNRAKLLAAESKRNVQGSVIALDKALDEQYAGRVRLSKDHKGNGYYAKPEVEALFKLDLVSLTLDEFHKFGLGEDRNTLFARAVRGLGANAFRRYALSGTPMGGKPIRLWGVLNFIEPDAFSSKWRWAEQWLEIDDNGFGKTIGGLIPGRDEEFKNAHGKHLVRRTRADALPGLPPKVVIDVWTDMTPKQRKVYEEFQAAAEVALEGGRISANGILAEYSRLKQLANALCVVRDGDVFPTTDSGKLPVLLDRLDTHGIRAKDAEPGARAIVASESKRMVELTAAFLAEQGLKVGILTGEVTGTARDAVIDWYKDLEEGAAGQEARVLVMTTQTGGVGLNLGMTGSIHILDETWNPDDQEQLEDRGMRNRTTPLNVLYYRTRETIQEYIKETTDAKAFANATVVDLKRLLRKGQA